MEQALSAVMARHGAELRRSVLNHRYEIAEGGLLFPEQKLLVGGVFGVQINDGPMEFALNRIVDDSLNYIINLILSNAPQISTWYVAQFAGNVTPAANLTALTFPTACAEFDNYDETTRPEYVEAGAANLMTSNALSPASYTVSAGGGIIYGAAIISSPVKLSTTGRLLAATRYTAAKTLDAGDVLKSQYTFSAQSA